MQNNSLAQAIERISLSILLTDNVFDMVEADTDAAINYVLRG